MHNMRTRHAQRICMVVAGSLTRTAAVDAAAVASGTGEFRSAGVPSRSRRAADRRRVGRPWRGPARLPASRWNRASPRSGTSLRRSGRTLPAKPLAKTTGTPRATRRPANSSQRVRPIRRSRTAALIGWSATIASASSRVWATRTRSAPSASNMSSVSREIRASSSRRRMVAFAERRVAGSWFFVVLLFRPPEGRPPAKGRVGSQKGIAPGAPPFGGRQPGTSRISHTATAAGKAH